ncbi:MAG: PAS domain S-box protein [Ignavibacteriales bacterium]|nr:PAS domain S-box protein [Ignavibacteriales bacterium]
MRQGQELRILLLEDNLTDAELIVQEVLNAGFSFIEKRVDIREKFISEIKNFAPDIILADYSLPQFSALEAFEILQELHSDIPVILVTGTQSEEVAVECMKQGAEDYILKQSLTRLPSAINKALEKKAMQHEKEQAEAALRKSENKFRLLFEHNPIPMFVYDIETLLFLDVNDAAVSHYGFSHEEFARMWITDLWALDDLQRLQTGRLMNKALLNTMGEWLHQRKNGETRTVQVISRLLEANHPRTALLIAEDITERTRAGERLKNSHEQLRALSAHLQSVREEERSRIALEIHDELGQILTAIRMDLSWLHDKFSLIKTPLRRTLMSHADSMTKLIDSTIQTVRRISTELRPRILDDLGLVAAAEWQAHEFEARTNIQCEFQANVEELKLDRERSTAVFRILQESLTNVLRHAKASRVTIDLHVSPSELILEVVDNGKGFEPDKPKSTHSFGLLGMQERALLLGGNVTIKRASKKGTIVSLELPLNKSS